MNVLSLAARVPDVSLDGWHHVRVRALLAGKRIDLRALQRGSELAGQPVAVPAGDKGLAVLFRYGAVVTFHMQPVEEAAFLKSLHSVVGDPFETTESEEAKIVVDATGGQTEGVDGSGNIRLQRVTMDRLLVVADVLAKSVILAYDENRVAAVFDRIEPVAERLHRAGRTVSVGDLLGHIADVLITQHRMVGRVEVTEKPELVWDSSDLERLYVRLRDEYELTERDRALSRKLELISQTATTSLGLVQAQRSLRVEWYIVILIVVEIFLTLYSMFIAGGPH
ncbi:MAG TPA: RMD1 family protein [Rhodospirillales bacterium]|nr:RMD1 family protein [Rhodospirillales bacterium]